MEAEVEVLEKILMYTRDISGDHTNHMKKWLVTKLKMDRYEASLCKTSWHSPFGLSKGLSLSLSLSRSLISLCYVLENLILILMSFFVLFLF